MINQVNKIIKESTVAMLMVGLVVAVFVLLAPQAQAQSTSDLKARLESLTAQLTNLQKLAVKEKSSTVYALNNGTIGDTVVTTDRLRVRAGASSDSEIYGVVEPGVSGIVKGAAVADANGVYWVEVDFSTGLSGWSAVNWLVVVNTSDTGSGSDDGSGDAGGGTSTGGTSDSGSTDDFKLPTCDYVNVSPSDVKGDGAKVTFTWETTGADSVRSVYSGKSLPEDGSLTEYITRSGVYALELKNDYGTSYCVTKVSATKSDKITNKPLCESFEVFPKVLPAGGGNVTWVWQARNVDKVKNASGVKFDPIGTYTEFIDETYTATLVAENSYGSDTCHTTVFVEGDVKNSDIKMPICLYYTATPNEVDENGGKVDLKWKTKNADSVTTLWTGVKFAANGSDTVVINEDIIDTILVENDYDMTQCSVRVTSNADEY